LNSTKKGELTAKLEVLPKISWPRAIFLAETWFGENVSTKYTGYIGKTETAEEEALQFTSATT
jgi:hypothetical protein